MRTIEGAGAFRRDYKRAKASPRHRQRVDQRLARVVAVLAADQGLPVACRDHALVGDWSGDRECHLQPDLLLISSKPDADTLRLARLGTHSELFG